MGRDILRRRDDAAALELARHAYTLGAITGLVNQGERRLAFKLAEHLPAKLREDVDAILRLDRREQFEALVNLANAQGWNA